MLRQIVSLLMLTLCIFSLSACVIEPVGPGPHAAAVWVPGHYDGWHWVHGHWA